MVSDCPKTFSLCQLVADRFTDLTGPFVDAWRTYIEILEKRTKA